MSKYKRTSLSTEQKREYYENGYVTLTVPIHSEKGSNPIKNIEPINEQIEDIIDKSIYQESYKFMRTHFSLQIGYNFGTEDSEAMLDHSVNVWDIGYKPLSYYFDEYSSLIPYDMGEYEGLLLYVVIDIRNPTQPIESVFERF